MGQLKANTPSFQHRILPVFNTPSSGGNTSTEQQFETIESYADYPIDIEVLWRLHDEKGSALLPHEIQTLFARF